MVICGKCTGIWGSKLLVWIIRKKNDLERSFFNFMPLRVAAPKRLCREPLWTLGDQDVPSWTSLAFLKLKGGEKTRHICDGARVAQIIANRGAIGWRMCTDGANCFIFLFLQRRYGLVFSPIYGCAGTGESRKQNKKSALAENRLSPESGKQKKRAGYTISRSPMDHRGLEPRTDRL